MPAGAKGAAAPRLATVALVLALTVGVPATAGAAASPASQGPPPPGVTVNGEPLDLSEVRIVDGVLYAPFDELVEAFAGRYYFDPASRTGRGFLTQEDAVVTARAGAQGLDVNGRRIPAAAPRMTSKLLVPVAAFFGGLGGEVSWDARLRRAVVRWSAAQAVEVSDRAAGQPGGSVAAAGSADPQPAAAPAAGTRARARLDPKELQLLEQVVNAEAYGAPEETQVAVAAVILNRLDSGYWGDSLTKVLMAPGQFAVVASGSYLRHPLMPTVHEAVQRALGGEDPTRGALYFTDLASVPAAWKNPARYTLTLTSGGMVFYRPK
ncbi:MAG: cell wall hydrolase [Bacillota bacterium]|nr:cell wall hydrolase [Bacillota bacterium]